MKHILKIIFIGLILGFLLSLVKQCTSTEFKPNNSLIEAQKDTIKDNQKFIDSLESEIEKNNLEILEYQNKLQISETKFNEFKKTPQFIEKIKYIKENISIDTLASNTIELEHCFENSKYKDSTIVVLENSIDISEIQKEKYKNTIEVQNKIENQLNENILFEINETKKANRKATYWKIATGTLAGLIIYDKIIK
jgi:chromosome condensin MukBEF ATPase and DNA-binding subunit MukB